MVWAPSLCWCVPVEIRGAGLSWDLALLPFSLQLCITGIEEKPQPPVRAICVRQETFLQAFMSLQGQENQPREKWSRPHVLSSSPKCQKTGTGSLLALFINPALSAPDTHRTTGQIFYINPIFYIDSIFYIDYSILTVSQIIKIFKHSHNFRKYSLFRGKKNHKMLWFLQQSKIFLFTQPNNFVLILIHYLHKKCCLTSDISFIVNSSKSNKWQTLLENVNYSTYLFSSLLNWIDAFPGKVLVLQNQHVPLNFCSIGKILSTCIR